MMGIPVGASTTPASIVPTSFPTAAAIPDEEDLEEIDLTELLKENPANKGIIGVRQFRRDFESLVDETSLTSLVILIDDLDRCEPKRLVETLEAIKLFLAVPHVAFVIGADERIVRYAIAKRYETGSVEAEEGRTDRHVDLVTDYLEKLVQIPYHLPRLSPSEIETYMSLLFCQLHLVEDFTIVHDAFLKARRENMTVTFRHQQVRQALQLQQKTCSADLETEMAWCSSIALSLSDILKGNPRQTKRLLNALLLRRKLAEAAHLDLSDQVLVKLMLLEYMRPKLFGQLYQWQAAEQGFPRQFRALEHGLDGEDQTLVDEAKHVLEKEPAWGEPSIRTWLQMPPSLAEQDLRDYFWITRDRIVGILAGVSTIPLHIRRIVSDLLETENGIILPETKAQIGELAQDEQSIVLEELANLLQREPGQRGIINAWVELVSIVPTASHRLVGTLEQLPASALDGSVPMKIAHMAQVHPAVRDRAVNLLSKWKQESRTLAGRSAEEALKDLMEDGA